MQRSIFKQLWYNSLHAGCRLASVVLFRIRVSGRRHLPRTGGVLVCANHQSHLDPVLVGLALDRRLNYLARADLFGFLPFRWLIQSLDAIPIDRDGIGLGGIKETLRRLRSSEPVLIFPEGTRTADGEVASLKPGFLALARRGRVPLLPVGIDGAYDAWPRTNWLPHRTAIYLIVGEPISASEMERLSDDELLRQLETRIRECHALAREGRQRAGDGVRDLSKPRERRRMPGGIEPAGNAARRRAARGPLPQSLRRSAAG